MLALSDFIKNSVESDESYLCYNIKDYVRILNQTVQQDKEEIRINTRD
ncbi:MAG: hypothetical protein Q8936_23275 [Bacillota bacterium]|nr:hypothetical protein [Bacillota bacterium]